MTQPLNYTAKAIEQLRRFPCEDAPFSRAALRYVADKLEQAEVFILPDMGQLLDRAKPRPEVPGLLFKPPFPVVACEYTATGTPPDSRTDPFYTAVPCSRRIALAWEWQDDLPPILRHHGNDAIGGGVAVMHVAYVDHAQVWTPGSAAIHLPYDGEWQHPSAATPMFPFQKAMIESGAVSSAAARSKGFLTSFIPLAMESLIGMKSILGSEEAVIDACRADTTDELNAYLDLCYALACKNVGLETKQAPVALNRQRAKKGKPPIKGFHVLKVAGEDASGLPGVSGHGSPRSHLRRGHIRRLSPERMTWVNSTIVRGRGFAEKAYAVGARP